MDSSELDTNPTWPLQFVLQRKLGELSTLQQLTTVTSVFVRHTRKSICGDNVGVSPLFLRLKHLSLPYTTRLPATQPLQ